MLYGICRREVCRKSVFCMKFSLYLVREGGEGFGLCIMFWTATAVKGGRKIVFNAGSFVQREPDAIDREANDKECAAGLEEGITLWVGGTVCKDGAHIGLAYANERESYTWWNYIPERAEY